MTSTEGHIPEDEEWKRKSRVIRWKSWMRKDFGRGSRYWLVMAMKYYCVVDLPILINPKEAINYIIHQLHWIWIFLRKKILVNLNPWSTQSKKQSLLQGPTTTQYVCIRFFLLPMVRFWDFNICSGICNAMKMRRHEQMWKTTKIYLNNYIFSTDLKNQKNSESSYWWISVSE